jgi:hypothetical protein
MGHGLYIYTVCRVLVSSVSIGFYKVGESGLQLHVSLKTCVHQRARRKTEA